MAGSSTSASKGKYLPFYVSSHERYLLNEEVLFIL
jgi:hypothetical protein